MAVILLLTSLLSEDTDPLCLDSQFEFLRTYSHQYQQRTVKLLLAELAVVLAVEASIGQFAEWTVALVSASF